MKVLGFDLSVRSTGWAFGEIGAVPKFGHVRFAPEHARPATVWFEAFKWFMANFEVMQPDIVAIEAAFAGNFNDSEGKPISSAHTHGVLWGLQSTIQMAAESRFAKGLLQKPALLIHESTAKKLMTGRGRWPEKQGKPMVKERCIALGWATVSATYDETDACAVWAAACCQLDRSFAANFTPLMAPRAAPAPMDVGF